MPTDATAVVDGRFEIGEGPLWHVADERLYWTDIPAGHLHRYDPETGDVERFYEGESVGGFTIQSDGSLALFLTEGHVAVLRDGDMETVIDGIAGEEGMRFNDVIADPQGRVFAGTMDMDDFSVGRLYRIDPDGTITEVVESLELPNGMGFTPDRSGLYLTESNANVIHRYDYDEETGEISDPETFAELPDGEGMYDGLTVDSEGRVWSALWEGNAVVRHDEDGGIAERFDIPAEFVTAPTFGGESLADMYVTSAAIDADPEDEHAGALFRLDPGVDGTPEFTSELEP